MSWTLPVPLPLFAGVVALWPLAALVRRPTPLPRLVRMDRALGARAAPLIARHRR